MASTNSIRLRLMLVVGLALAPLALASIIQAVLNFRAYQRETDRILMQTALYAAYSEQNVFTRAEQLLRSIARRPDKTDTREKCYAELSDSLVGAMPIINLTRVDASGNIICMGAVSPTQPIAARLNWWNALRSSKTVVVGNQFQSKILKKSVLPMAMPVYNGDGSFAGAVSAAIDLDWLETAPQVTKLPEGALSLILDKNGNVFATNHPVPSGIAEAVIQNAKEAKRKVFTLNTGAGSRWRWVAEPIGISDKYVAFGIPEPRLLGTFRGYLLADVLLTILIIGATVAAIWLGTEWLVIRWTIYLKRVAVAYGRNHFTLSLDDLRAAPDEFKLLGREMKRMAIAIQDRDRNLSKALERQFSMTREIHHRVKNNLQIVSSLIAIYAQNIANPVARSAFRQIIVRVDALTLIQRLIEKSESDPMLDMQVLFAQLADQLRTVAHDAGQIFSLQISISHRWLSPDTATPIVLFAVEAISFDMFLPRAEGRLRDVRLSFASDPGGCQLIIEERDNGSLPTPGSLSARILRSLSEQLRGRYADEPLPHGGTKLTLFVPSEGAPSQAKTVNEDYNVFTIGRTRQL
ncbi:two-component sensor histidine kinase [Rhizomicrobium palustre]|uniref:histidine kinase n=1 Tax=Rhizomicrobium palustre TaxID=189966 RepID=A0A846N0Y0_9PROT|nr:sensor histidine kinase [Rhizomicrobium palustre]NIK89223.1 two-component sensor histidine kinase [Rhizomicrobium palustre]